MSDMYDKISRPAERAKRKKSAALFVALAAAALAIGLWVLSAYGILSVGRRFNSFVIALSDSTVYAYANDTLRAEVEGEVVRVSGENNYSLYHAVSVMEPSGRLLRAPEGPADILLDYGDGSVLRLWKMKGEDGQALSFGVELAFETGEGQRFLFRCKTENLGPLIKMASLSANEAWEE